MRDVRRVWASLFKKPYASNGITAEDPPLRLRLHRFKEDWELFQRMDWPTLRYESLLASPEKTLQEACSRLDLPWDDAMVSWLKSEDEIADTQWGNESFRSTRGTNLFETLARYGG